MRYQSELERIDILELNSSKTGQARFTYVDKGTWRVHGTFSSFGFYNFINTTNSFPKYFEPGGIYYIQHDISNSNLIIDVYYKKDSSDEPLVLNRFTKKNSANKLYRITMPSAATGMLIRLRVDRIDGSSFPIEIDETVHIHIFTNRINSSDNALMLTKGLDKYAVDNVLDLNNVLDPGYYTISDTYTVLNRVEGINLYGLKVEAYNEYSTNFVIQYLSNTTNTTNPPYMYYRIHTSGDTWTNWISFLTDQNAEKNLNGYASQFSSCDDIDRNCIVFVSVTSGQLAIPDFPYNNSGWLRTSVVGTANTLRLQIAYSYTVDNGWKWRRRDINGNWSNWVEVSSNSGEIIYETRLVSQDTYQNSYTINTSPTITTDTNGWLQAVDTSTLDETGKTDMTGAIMSMLNDTGYCHLGPGIFYVSGSIDMPENSTLEGCGKDTTIRLLQTTTAGYCVRMSEFCTVKGIRFSGSYNDINIDSGNIGTRSGIVLIGNADGQNTTAINPRDNYIDGCYFFNFSGNGIYQSNSGGSVVGALYMTNCFIQLCGAGININYYSEYCKYTNIIINHCYYACINNGGNNVFTNCTFHGTVGFFIDNSNDDKRNNAHGSAVACTFNHIDNWNRPGTLGGGDAIRAVNVSNGFIFSGCQIWYGAINLDNCRGIQVSNTLIGGGTPSIKATGTYPMFMHNCIFQNTPTIQVPSNSKFDGCYLSLNGSSVNP